MVGLKKEDLRPGMKVRNVRSGFVGKVRGDDEEPTKLAFCAKWCICVHVKIQSGKNKGRLEKRTWDLSNLELA